MLHPGTFDKEAFLAQWEGVLGSADELLRYQKPDFFAVTGDLIQAAMGPKWARELEKELADRTGKPATTATTAVTDALDHLGVKRVAVGTPHRDDQNEHFRSYLTDAGFEVTAISGYHTNGHFEIHALPETTPYEKGKEVFLAAPGAQAIYLTCPLWHGATDTIEKLEKEFDVPVLTQYNPILWKGLRALEYKAPVKGFGRLLASVG
jgi:arylmalonate decarboxylase